MSEQATILIIDDNVALARGFARALNNAGYIAHIASTADDGLLLARGEHPDAIILDFRMPFVNGVGLLYRLRAERTLRNTPVMILTGESVTEETRAEIAGLGAVLRMKPLGLEDLLNEVRALLD